MILIHGNFYINCFGLKLYKLARSRNWTHKLLLSFKIYWTDKTEGKSQITWLHLFATILLAIYHNCFWIILHYRAACQPNTNYEAPFLYHFFFNSQLPACFCKYKFLVWKPNFDIIVIFHKRPTYFNGLDGQPRLIEPMK